MTDPSFESLAKPKNPQNKYWAKKVQIDWHKFDSKFESKIYEILRDDPRVTILDIHPRYLLQEKYQTKDKRKIRAIEYVSDFLIDVEWDIYVLDAKGRETTDFKIKRKIFEYRYQDLKLLVAHSQKELRELIFD